jgi:hypothetical protein
MGQSLTNCSMLLMSGITREAATTAGGAFMGFDPSLAFKRAQLLEFDKRPLAQFAYLDPAGVPVAFCATRTSEADSPIRAGSCRGLAAAFWSMNDYGFIVIGATQRDVAARRGHFGRTDPGCPACVQRVTRAPLLPERLVAPELVRSPSRRGSKLAGRFFAADVTAARS